MDLETMLKTRSNQPVYYAFAVSLVFYILLKFFLGSFWVAIVGNLIFYSPLIVLAVIFFLIHRKSKDFPEEKHIVRRHYLIMTLKLLAIILAFHLIYTPGTLIPLFVSLAKIIQAFFSIDSFFFFFSYFFIVIIAGSIIFLSFRAWQKSQGKYEGTMPVLIRRNLYGIFFLCLLFLGTSAFAFPKAYKPFTDALGNVIYNASGGKIQMNGNDPAVYKRISSIKAAASEIASSLSQTKSSLTDSLQEKSANFTNDLSNAQSSLTSSIRNTKNDLEDQLDDDLGDKLNESGGTISGELTVEDIINAEGGIDLGSNTFSISSTTLISNLNADLLDGHHWSEIPDGVTDHSLLTNLAYAGSGHTGFEPTVSKGNLTAGSTKISIGGTGTGALIGAGATVDIVEANLTHNSLGGLTTGNPHTQYVLYSGATSDVDLGSHSLTADDLTVSSLTSGRIPYLSTGGLFTDNDKLQFINTTVPIVQIGGTNADMSASIPGINIWSETMLPRLALNNYSNTATDSGYLYFIRFRGTQASKGSVLQNDTLGRVLFGGGISSGTSGAAAGLFSFADENFTSGYYPARLSFVTGWGSTTGTSRFERLKVLNTGEIQFPNYDYLFDGDEWYYSENGYGQLDMTDDGNMEFSNTAGDITFIGSQVGIGMTPAYQFQLSTDSAAKPSTNTWTIASDERIKKDIADFTDGLDTLLKIQPRTYRYNGAGGVGLDNTDETHIGIIAQELKKVAPYMVEIGSGVINGKMVNDFESYQGHALSFIIVNAIKEQQSQIIGLTDNQNEIAEQLTGQLADQELSMDERINLIGENLDKLKEDQKTRSDRNNQRTIRRLTS